MSTSGSPTWVSQAEVHPTTEQLAWIASLESADAQFDREVAAIVETSVLRTSQVKRVSAGILRRIRARFPHIGQLVRKIGRLFLRLARKTTRRFSLSRLPNVVQVGALSARVIHLDASEAIPRIAGADLPLTILVRDASRVTPGDLNLFAEAMAATPEADFWYADSLSPQGFRIYRPAPSHLLTEQTDWLGAIVGVRTSRLHEILPDEADDTALSIPQRIALGIEEAQSQHLAIVAGTAAFSETLAAYPAEPRKLSSEPLVSIVIPTRGTGDLVGDDERVFVVDAVRSIIERTRYRNFEIVIVADEPTPQSVVDELESLASNQLKFVRWSAPFNFSEKMNLGAAVAQGQLLLMLNDDIEVASADWLGEMVVLLQRTEFAATGALLFFEDLSLQHAGHLYRGGAGHVGFGKPLTPRDPNTYLHLDREVSGVTGACMLLPKDTFAEVGGFSVRFPGNYNDVDLCLKIRAAGGRIACCGGARLYHFESKSRDATVRPEDLERIHARWSAELTSDSFWTDPG